MSLQERQAKTRVLEEITFENKLKQLFEIFGQVTTGSWQGSAEKYFAQVSGRTLICCEEQMGQPVIIATAGDLNDAYKKLFLEVFNKARSVNPPCTGGASPVQEFGFGGSSLADFQRSNVFTEDGKEVVFDESKGGLVLEKQPEAVLA